MYTNIKMMNLYFGMVIEQYFKQPNYFRIDNKPVFSIFSLHNLIEGLDGLENTRKALKYFRTETKNAGFPGLHIQLIGMGAPNERLVESINYLGINSITKYNWGGPHPEDYIQWGMEAIERRNKWDSAFSIPYFPNVSIGCIIIIHLKVLVPSFKRQKNIVMIIRNSPG